MRSVIIMQNNYTPISRGTTVYVSRSLMERIFAGPKMKYDAKKASKEAKKRLREQGLRV